METPEPAGPSLRPYQRECLEAIYRSYREGFRRVLVSLPTGTGKTVIFAQFPQFFRMKNRLLVLAHREELLEQARAKFQRSDPALSVEIEQAERHASPDCKVVLASVPTIGREQSQRLAALRPESFYLVVVDEAHHAVARSYRTVFEQFGLFAPGTPRMLVGFTATPRRSDQQDLSEVFERIVYQKTLEEMIRDRYLCQLAGWRVCSEVDLDDVHTRAGDFVSAQLARAVDVAERNGLIVRAYQELAPGRRCIVFCVNVAHANDLAAAFQGAGLRAAAVFGDMPRNDRHQVLSRFSAGELEVVTNCNVLTEGFDEPRVDCIIMARPTKSQLLYAQMVGRGTRLHPDKSDLLVIDIVDNSRKHSLVGLHTLFRLPRKLNLRGHNAVEVADLLFALTEQFPWLDVEQVEAPDDLKLVTQRIDLFRLEPPAEVAEQTRFAWTAEPGGGYRLSLPGQERLSIQQNLLDEWEIQFFSPGEPNGRRKIGGANRLAEAIYRADAFVERERGEAVKIVDLSARWRDRPPTAAQLGLLQQKKIPVPPGLTRGQASWMIALLSGKSRP